LDYLLKPIDKTELKKALEKYTETIQDKNQLSDIESIRHLFKKEYKKRFIVKVGNQFKSFKVEDIAYFMADEGVIFLYSHTGHKSPIEYTIDQLESILDPVQFFRINRKFMISVNCVTEIHTYYNSRLLLKIDPKQVEQVIVSRERTTNFKRWLDM
jgi:DNA-binding LytR/AlgR family response regulator